MSSDQNIWSIKRLLALGFVALFVLVVGLGAWSTNTNIAGAIIASGLIEVEVNRQVVQHPDGGVIEKLLVDDGDVVEVGDVLLRFDGSFLQSDLNVITEQLFEIMARTSRLVAERDDSDTVTFDSALLTANNNPIIADLVAGQINLFEARRTTLTREEALLNQRKSQINDQNVGANVQIAAMQLQQDLIAEELTDEILLLGKGLSEQSTVRELKREAARLEGVLGGLYANIAANSGKMSEIDIEILRLASRLREDSITALRDMQYRENEIRETQTSMIERLQRMEVRAPTSGIIYGKQFHALRSVVRAADTILFIVPQDSPLVIAIRIPAIHIDQVHVGQSASLHFSAFDTRTTPVVMGSVTKISPDIFVDEMTGETYYSAEIIPLPEELIKLDGLEVLPGMPVDAFLKTADRTPLEYLVKPLADYFNKAFREN